MNIPNQIGGYQFKNVKLLENALTHSSYANEKKLSSNERLEFLGDAVLGFISAEHLYKTYSQCPEGDLTKMRASIVCEQSLSKAAQEIKLDELLRLGHGEEVGGGRKRPSILADAFESVLAAIYLDGGISAAKEFVMPFVLEGMNAVEHGSGAFFDYKTMLQEIVQKNREEVLKYVVKDESGPAHDKKFTVELFLNSNVVSSGDGHSKKEAEQNAAKAALQLMGEAV